MSETQPPLAQKPSFTPLDARAFMAIAKVMGIDTSKTVDLQLGFDSPGVTFIAVKYLVDAVQMAQILDALAAIPTESLP